MCGENAEFERKVGKKNPKKSMAEVRLHKGGCLAGREKECPVREGG